MSFLNSNDEERNGPDEHTYKSDFDARLQTSQWLNL